MTGMAERGRGQGTLRRMLLVSLGLPAMGGAEARVTHLAVRLARLGIDTTLLTCDPVSASSRYLAELREARVRFVSACFWCRPAARLLAWIAAPFSPVVRALFARRFPQAAKAGTFDSLESVLAWTFTMCMREYTFGAAAWLAIAALRPQVVHAFKPTDTTADAIRMCKRLGIPVVYSDTGEAVPSVPDYTPAVLRSGRLADALLVTCRTVAENARTLYGRSENVLVFPPVLPRLEWVPSRASNGTVSLGYAGRITDEKNLYGLLQALGKVGEAACPWRLVVAGDGEDLERCRSLTRRLGMEDKVSFLPPYEGQEGFREFAAQMDLFVLPSKSEGFPVVLVEVAAAGRPAVATPVGGVPEVVQEGVTGFLAQGSDPDTLARAIGRALEHPERLSAMGARARRLYEEQFEPDMALGRMVGFYSSLVEGRAGRRS